MTQTVRMHGHNSHPVPLEARDRLGSKVPAFLQDRPIHYDFAKS